MKRILKHTLFFLLGACAGFGIVTLCSSLFTGTSPGDFFAKMSHAQILLSGLLSLVYALAGCLLALFAQIILHEVGHLLLGLATGYRFVSFRVGSLTLIKDKGRFRFKRFSIAGTGGQCLLAPPEEPYNRLPYFWYNAGGVLMNLLTAIPTLVLWLLIPDKPLALNLFLLLFSLCGCLLALMNGIPMKLSGITNDAYNLLSMYKEPESRKYLAQQLSIHAALVAGVQLKDMPEAWFANDEITDYGNPLQVSAKATVGSRHIDRGEFEAAMGIFKELKRHEKEMAGLLVKEIDCELLFLELVGNTKPTRIEALYTDALKTYVMSHKKVMSSKQRLLCALALYKEKQPEKAKKIYEEVLRKRNSYLQQGEVTSDLEIMEKMLQGRSEHV